MRNRKWKTKSNSYYDNKSYVKTPELPKTPTTSAVFPDHKTKLSTDANFSTPFEKYRSYDAELNKIDVNIVGYAPLYGKETPSTSLNLGNDVGLFTGAFTDTYNRDTFSLLALINRDISVNYWGIDFTDLDTSTTSTKLADRAVATWEKNTNTLLSQLRQAMYTDLRFLQWGYQGATVNNNSKYSKVLSAPSYMLLAYQLQLQQVLLTILNFEMLTAQLPILQKYFKNKSDFIVNIQDQLKRSQYTAPIRSLLTWLKRRFVDVKFFKQFILPTAIISKPTDGLNSPITYLTHTISIPLEVIQYVNPDGSIQQPSSIVPVEFFTSGVTYTKRANGTIEGINGTERNKGILRVKLNAFNISTILDILLSTDSPSAFSTRLEAWFTTAKAVINDMVSKSLDISGQDWFRDVEAALAKLASQPSGLNWQQNIDPASLTGMREYAHYELVDTLATFMSPQPIPNDNGYTLKIPQYRRIGFKETMIKEHAQAFYLPSNDVYMSFIKLGNKISFTTRQNKRLVGTVTEVNSDIPVLELKKVNLTFSDKGVPTYVEENVNLFNTNDQAYLVLQDSFTKVRGTTANSPTWVNSELINVLPAIFQNRWADYVKLATENYIIPLA